jgi:carboxyl-terminal processing protease
MKNNRLTNIVLLISAGIILFGSGYQIGLSQPKSSLNPTVSFNNTRVPSQHSDIDFSEFWDTWDKLEEKYVDKKKINSEKMFYGAIKGMVASVDDPYTFFLTPQENKQSKDDLGGKFEGIGAQLGLKDGRIVIVAPLKGSPAEKAGVKAGDYVIKVDAYSTKGWTLPQAVSKIRGDKGTKVALTLERNQKEFKRDIVRDQINISSVEVSFETSNDCDASCPKVGYLKLNQFGDNTNTEWNKAIDKIKAAYDKKEIRAMVLDLRDNPGGYLDSAVYTASEFLPKDKLVVKQESSSGDSKPYTVYRQGKLLDIPLVVMLNKGSASASEILAGSLRDYDRAILVGEKSFGKGSVQEALDMANGAGLHVTVAKWILPKGEWINGKGITPAIVVENKLKEGDTLTKETDTQLQRAIQEALKQ